MKITIPNLAVSVCRDRGLGFLAAGFDTCLLISDLATVSKLYELSNVTFYNSLLPIGVGLYVWGFDLNLAVKAIEAYPVAAVWCFMPRQPSDLMEWAAERRRVSDGMTRLWMPVETVAEAVKVCKTCKLDVLVV